MPPPPPGAWAPPPMNAIGPAPGWMYASVGRRIGGYILDAVLVGIVGVAAVWSLVGQPVVDYLTDHPNTMVSVGSSTPYESGVTMVPIQDIVSSGNLAAAAAIYIGIILVYQTLLSAFGGTLGQRAFGMRTVNARDGAKLGIPRGFVRSIFFWGPTLVPFGFLITLLAFLWAAWDPRKQGLHDKLAGSFVVRALPQYGPPGTWQPAPGQPQHPGFTPPPAPPQQGTGGHLPGWGPPTTPPPPPTGYVPVDDVTSPPPAE